MTNELVAMGAIVPPFCVGAKSRDGGWTVALLTTIVSVWLTLVMG
jgi:hypothetical protein